MKKTLSLTVLFCFASLALFADTSFWVGPDSVSSPWDNSSLSAYSDLYETGSVLSLTSDKATINVVIEGKKPENMEGRDLGLTKAALEELGIWGEGHNQITVMLRKGSMLEDKKEEKEESGWYVLRLEGIEEERAYEVYRTLIRKGFKVQTEILEDGLWYFSLPYIVRYEVEEKKEALLSLGLSIKEEEPCRNPYSN